MIDRFIIEIASNHAGDPSRFNHYCKLASDLDAELKFQIFDCKSLCHSSYKFIDDLSSVSLSFGTWKSLIVRCLDNGLKLWLEPFDHSSLEFCREFSSDVSVKVPSCDALLTNISDLSMFKETGFAIGGLSINEISRLYDQIKGLHNVLFFYGFQAFPTHINDINISKLDFICKNFDTPIVYADHTDLMLDNKCLMDIVSIARSYSCGIERHICLNYNDLYDTVSASEPSDLTSLFEILRSADLSSESFSSDLLNKSSNFSYNEFTPSELHYRSNMQKKVVLCNTLMPNEPILSSSVQFLRTTSDDDILSFDFMRLLSEHNLFASHQLSEGHILKLSDLLLR